MTVHIHHLSGCAPTPLAWYLKGLGILRLVAEQKDPEARGWWQDEAFHLATTLSCDDLERFFLHEYAPTAIIAPWNKGSGFVNLEGRPISGHRHLHILPLSLDGQGRLDHFLLWAPMGLDGEAQQAIFGLRQVWTKGDEKPLYVTVAGMGALQDFANVLRSQRILGPACAWASITPFVPPRHVKNRRHTFGLGLFAAATAE